MDHHGSSWMDFPLDSTAFCFGAIGAAQPGFTGAQLHPGWSYIRPRRFSWSGTGGPAGTAGSPRMYRIEIIIGHNHAYTMYILYEKGTCPLDTGQK